MLMTLFAEEDGTKNVNEQLLRFVHDSQLGCSPIAMLTVTTQRLCWCAGRCSRFVPHMRESNPLAVMHKRCTAGRHFGRTGGQEAV
jgi:hypothetical protein